MISTLPPIETFLRVPSDLAREHFFKLLEVNDVFIGMISAIDARGMIIKLLCFDNKKRRDIESISINAFCSLTCMQQQQQTNSMKNSVNYFHQNDLVRCTIKSFDSFKQTCDVWFRFTDDYKPEDSIKLVIYIRFSFENVFNILKLQLYDQKGPINACDFPIYYQNTHYKEKYSFTYNEMIEKQELFNNSACIQLLAAKFNVNTSSTGSLMKGLIDLNISNDEMATGLRKTQTKNLALQSVSRGISLFKENKSDDALLQLNKALSIDRENVEALVARGALYANSGDFSKAIEDFEEALKHDSENLNAKKYLEEVLKEQLLSLEKSKSFDALIECSKKLINLNKDEFNLVEFYYKKIDQAIENKNQLNQKLDYGPRLPPSKEKETMKNKKKKRYSSTSSSSSVQLLSPIRSVVKVKTKNAHESLKKSHRSSSASRRKSSYSNKKDYNSRYRRKRSRSNHRTTSISKSPRSLNGRQSKTKDNLDNKRDNSFYESKHSCIKSDERLRVRREKAFQQAAKEENLSSEDDEVLKFFDKLKKESAQSRLMN